MTGQEFSEVDFDLLADYVGGALDGTPEETVVARRVAEEPAWAEAHAALVEATGSVRASLAAWGSRRSRCRSRWPIGSPRPWSRSRGVPPCPSYQMIKLDLDAPCLGRGGGCPRGPVRRRSPPGSRPWPASG
ncbi:hypothetical protein Psuf_032540 [Phytohabitans suffuscus]|uniref:Uncharacterized protein n=1 Tax=Phytohabitans suffuscus TaxID=624315 RepID=A0A6F8YJ23_9ACTN|nr:hypothetical protein [Phytohabitans suffuscus]BCB85941.1 hypothetical protein Psuf_032540 [Phytohabitans suffuscus]